MTSGLVYAPEGSFTLDPTGELLLVQPATIAVPKSVVDASMQDGGTYNFIPKKIVLTKRAFDNAFVHGAASASSKNAKRPKQGASAKVGGAGNAKTSTIGGGLKQGTNAKTSTIAGGLKQGANAKAGANAKTSTIGA